MSYIYYLIITNAIIDRNAEFIFRILTCIACTLYNIIPQSVTLKALNEPTIHSLNNIHMFSFRQIDNKESNNTLKINNNKQ